MNPNRQAKALDIVKNMEVEQVSPLSFVVKGQIKDRIPCLYTWPTKCYIGRWPRVLGL